MISEFLLEMTNIDKSFPGVKALNQANLKVRRGTVHALMGENGAGKSTLMKCLFGIYLEDAGEIKIEGKAIKFRNPKQALDHGVAMVHQELNQVLQRSIMENIWLGRFPKRGPLIDHKSMYLETKKIFEELDIHDDPRQTIGKLSVAERQMVEIAKAVSYNAKILVLDEPTSSLTEKEVDHLFRIINKLRVQGVGIIYISHKIEEILKISDEVTIMRDGQWIATRDAASLTTQEIVKLMVGRDLTNRYPPKTNKPGETLMEIRSLSGKFAPTCVNISLDLHRGEILGIAGLVGSRRTELLETIFGTRTKQGGEILVRQHDGSLSPVHNQSSRDAISNGFAMLTEERRATGIFGGMSITFNATIANISSYVKHGFLSNKTMGSDTKWVIDTMSVKTPSQKTTIRSLSGGNQQKVIIGRWLLTKPDILLLDEPTRGIDVGAKYEIYQLIIDLANEGKGVIMVSSEMPELLGICDRIAVVSKGHLAGILDRNEATQEKIPDIGSTIYLIGEMQYGICKNPKPTSKDGLSENWRISSELCALHHPGSQACGSDYS